MISRFLKRAVTGIIILTSGVLHGSPLKSDETVVFFPTAAHINNDLQWEVPIHLWVFEKENQSLFPNLLQKALSEIAEALEIREEEAHSELFKQRIMWFLVDNERRKSLDIIVEGIRNPNNNDDVQKLTRQLNLSTANGHSKTTILIPSNLIKNKKLKYQVKTQNKKFLSFVGESQLIPPKGRSVISDIDDTIKNQRGIG